MINKSNTLYISFYDKNIDYHLKQLEKNNKSENIIPKIIHKIAPEDKSNWRPIWTKSHKSWIKYYKEPEYKIIMWNDDDINNFIKEKYPWFYPIYNQYPYKIQKIDVVRLFILYTYGGIYADMDYECFKNFYDLLPSNQISIVENSYSHKRIKSLLLENSLMASPKNNTFWLKAIKLAANSAYNKAYRLKELYILNSTGPMLLCKLYDKNINILPKKYYNNRLKNKKDMIGNHHYTGIWTGSVWKYISNIVSKIT